MLNFALVTNPPFTVALVTWVVVSAGLTALLRFRSDEEWIALASRWPRVGALVAFVRAMGIDPVGALGALRRILLGASAGRAPSPEPSSDLSSEEETSTGGDRSLRSTAALSMLLFALSLGGCSGAPGLCEIIDTLDNVCTVVVVRAPDGSRREVRVSRAELEALGQRVLARELVADGGASLD